ncbi:VWA domain-containing protein [Actinoalloteichus hymeniacidonis]|uniref:von Willebrand factor type A domain/Aerotolerance regulator N-terminal n=1 Tax=Actinoalloteichus hymeniacidonis TaxID=340345 RepID=A0AAC9HQ84_9PSEU|nr:VWA domain-containing protein [Actinoalloteichus hymeniacidonis]AOS62991.1 von Willebrand factor type A domain/Aerotolerance regulator N-terminal [Actinoalloteichus hymeniacidonis]MBB5908974.1 Ca-activated chloride channel family protein [Actinoalloteichus hymeniacidonis]
MPSLRGFVEPWWFLLLLLIAALVVGYVLAMRRRRRDTLRFANLELLEKVAPARNRRRRHLAPVLLGVSLIFLTIGMAGPTSEQRVPRNRATVMLAIDVSMSMNATDIEPSRLAAAKAAATSFVADMTPGVNIGLISFAGSATVLVPPTTERDTVTQAIDGLDVAEATATGEGITASLAAIDTFGSVVGGAEGPPPARIVLMTDGKSTVGMDALVAAQDAADREVPISTISFGTDGGQVEIEGEPVPVPVDDLTMQEIAEISGGEFHKAASAEELRRVYDTLGEQIGYQLEQRDASRPWFVLGTISALLAGAASLLIGQRSL